MAVKKKSESFQRLSEIMGRGYMELHERAQKGAFVVWIAIIVPVELFHGFENVVCAVPESHAATSAAKGVGVIQAEKAERLGYSMDLCSYARIDMGSAFDNGRDSPTFGLPRPQMMISNNNNCSLLVKWFDVYRRKWNIPHFVLDVPFCYEEQKARDLQYILDQFGELISAVEKLSGQRFDPAGVEKALSYTYEGVSYWKRFLEFARHRPSGITVFDSFVQMAPVLTLRGTPQFAEHYRLLYEETCDNVEHGEFPVPGERVRLLWDNIAPWHQLRKMSQRLAEQSVNIVAAPYTWCFGSKEGDFALYPYEGDFLAYMARMQNNTVCPHGLSLRKKAMEKAIPWFGADGVVFASNRSCKVFSVMQQDLMRHVIEKMNVPAVMIDVDHADARKYSEEEAFVRLSALRETIEARWN
ncbi:MAG: 2-hydroxyacyl-CoA dehydratase family protein [Thermodesulfobacteriota bacterium]